MKLLKVFVLATFFTGMETAMADAVHLANGDRISGTIIERGETGISLLTSFGAEVSIDAAHIASVETESQTGKEIAAEEMVAAVEEAAAIEAPQQKRAWESDLALNSSFSRGNTDSDLINLQAGWGLEQGQHRYSADLALTREEKEGDKVKEQDRVNLGYHYLYSEKWFFAVNATMERDPVALIDHRYSITPGVGYDIWNEDDRTLNVQMGVGYSSEEVNNVDDTGSQVDWRLNYDQKILEGGMKVFHKHQIYRNLQGRKNVVFNSQTGVRYDLSDQLFLNVQLNYDYDNEPAPGTDSKDLTFLVGAGMTL